MSNLFRCPFCNGLRVSDQNGADIHCCGESGQCRPADISTAGQFFELLTRHDWYYQHADDYCHWVRGSHKYQALCHIAKGNPECSALLAAFSKHKFEGGPRPADPRMGVAA